MKSGLISIIVPVYKAEAFLESCVSSILSQTFTNLEIILVNDGSPDSSGAICDEFARTDVRVKVIHKPNGGAASARNAGLNNAQGEFVGFVDSDDSIDANMYERMYKRISETGADICVCGYKMLYEGYQRIIQVPHENVVSPTQFWEEYIMNSSQYYSLLVSPCNKIYKMALLRSNPLIRLPESLNIAEDQWFVTDYIAATKNGIAFINFAPYNYVQTNNPTSLSKNLLHDDRTKATLHRKEVMLSMIPERSIEIEKTIKCELSVLFAIFRHKSIIYKHKQLYKLSWDAVITILRYSTSLAERFSALMLYFFPPPIYRAVFSLYAKSKK